MALCLHFSIVGELSVTYSSSNATLKDLLHSETISVEFGMILVDLCPTRIRWISHSWCQWNFLIAFKLFIILITFFGVHFILSTIKMNLLCTLQSCINFQIITKLVLVTLTCMNAFYTMLNIRWSSFREYHHIVMC